jgi:hypothetical protein
MGGSQGVNMWFFLLFLFPFIATASPEILRDFTEKGYHEMELSHLREEDFLRAYSCLDELESYLADHPDFSNLLHQVDLAFAAQDKEKIYGSPPFGFVDQRKSTKSNKCYFHYTQEYETHLRKKQGHLLEMCPPLEALLEALKPLEEASRVGFENSIQSIDLSVPIRQALYTQDGRIPVLLKVVKYQSFTGLSSHPHVDFSALSLLLHNSEDTGAESLRIAPYSPTLSFDHLVAPVRRFSKSRGEQSVLLIPGLALLELGYPIAPTPHTVLPCKSDRYATISFAMAPQIDLDYSKIRVSIPNDPMKEQQKEEDGQTVPPHSESARAQWEATQEQL